MDPLSVVDGANVPVVEERTRVAGLDRDDRSTWSAFQQSTRGMRVPRTSALLAALWPAHHVIVDWRSLSSAFALVGPMNGWRAPMPAGSSTDSIGSPSWEHYGWYRDRVLADAADLDLAPVKIERALFLIAKVVRYARGCTWHEYANAVADARRRLNT